MRGHTRTFAAEETCSRKSHEPSTFRVRINSWLKDLMFSSGAEIVFDSRASSRAKSLDVVPGSRALKICRERKAMARMEHAVPHRSANEPQRSASLGCRGIRSVRIREHNLCILGSTWLLLSSSFQRASSNSCSSSVYQRCHGRSARMAQAIRKIVVSRYPGA
jgi:hypothetical protein